MPPGGRQGTRRSPAWARVGPGGPGGVRTGDISTVHPGGTPRPRALMSSGKIDQSSKTVCVVGKHVLRFMEPGCQLSWQFRGQSLESRPGHNAFVPRKGKPDRKTGTQSHGPSFVMAARLPKGSAGEEPVHPRASTPPKRTDACSQTRRPAPPVIPGTAHFSPAFRTSQ